MQVTCCTCITAGGEEYKDYAYDIVLIDEAAQATEPECLVPIILHSATRVILVGDHKQLGPIILSNMAKEADLDKSLFERLMQRKNIKEVMLNMQYRMHPLIAYFPSKTFYNGEVMNCVNELDRTLKFDWLREQDNPVIFFYINGTENPIGTSYNDKEAQYIITLLKNLMNNFEPEQIGIIVPYEGQNRCLRQKMNSLESSSRAKFAEIEVANVDGFQGREKQIIILSFVRSNSNFSESIGWYI